MLNAMLVASCASEPQPVSKDEGCLQTPRFENGALISKDCAALPGQYWRASSAKGGIVLLHNFGDFHKAFAQLGPQLKDAGYSSLAFDQRGFGDAGERGRWYGEEALINDASAAASVLRDDMGGGPIYILGESMGGSVAILLASKTNDIDGLILAAPGVREGIDNRWFWDAALAVGDAIAPSADITNERGDGANLAREAKDRLSQSDKVVTDVRIDTYSSLVDLTDAASQAAYDVEVPTLLLYGGEDTTIDPVAIKNAKKALGQVTYKHYPQSPHLLFQSVYKDQILKDTLDWLDTR